MLSTFQTMLREKGSVDIVIRVRPHAAKTQLQSVMEDGSVKIDVAAPAEDGRGNTVLIKFLADAFAVPSSNVKILSGKTARMKLVRITAALR
jgi:uncharacterized protein (TIGR00251 family)